MDGQQGKQLIYQCKDQETEHKALTEVEQLRPAIGQSTKSVNNHFY